jgi:hypothetical protein
MRALAVVIVPALSVMSCGGDSCELKPELLDHAGRGARDCGHVSLTSSAAEVDECVVEAFRNHEAFVAEYDREGEDSRVVFGLAGDAEGNVSFLWWDSDPSGGSGEPAVISGGTCTNASVDTSTTRDPESNPPLICDSEFSIGRTCG